MRVTIDIDEKSGTAATNSGPQAGGTSSAGTDGAADTSAATPPHDVLELAAATGAINGGPAPGLSASGDSAPHPYHSRGGAMTDAAHAAAVSGGGAPNH